MDGGTEVYGTLVSDIQTDVSVTGKPVYLSASGNEITVDVKKGNMINPIVTMKPIQDLNGYDNPWVGGAGKNKCEYSNATNPNKDKFSYTKDTDGDVEVEKTSSGGSFFARYLMKVEANTEYIFSFTQRLKDNVDVSQQIYIYSDELWGNVITNFPISAATKRYSWTSSVTGTIVIGLYDGNAPIGTEIVIKGFMGCLSTATNPTTYEPYSNICPITARTSTEVSVNGSITTREYGQEIYGGTDDIVEGVVTNSWVELNITSPENIRRNNAKQYYIRSTINFEVNSTNIVSDKFRTASSGSGVCFLNQNGNIRFNTVDAYESAEDLFNTIGAIKFVAKVQTPQEILTTKGYIPLDRGSNVITVSNDDIITFDYYSTLAGKISGTLSYIENGLSPSGYLSGSGNFLALHLDSEDWDIYTSVKVGLYPSEGSGMVEILTDEDKICVGKITSTDQVFKVESTDGTITKTDVYSLSDLVLETE